MRRWALGCAIAGLLGLAACGSGGSGPTGPQQRPVFAPPAIVRVGGFEFAGERLPAISADGHVLAHTYMAEDGGRGAPNYKLVVKDVATDAVIKEIVILTVDEAERDPDDKTLKARVGEANSWLASGDWIPMIGLEPIGEETPSKSVAGKSLRVVYDEPTFAVYDSGRPVLNRRVTAWSAPRTATCTNPAGLGAVWTSLDGRVLLLTVSYKGNDTCWEPDSQMHAVRIR